MKKIILLLASAATLVIFSFATSSCTKAGDNVDSKAIVGKWYLVHQVDKYYENDEIKYDQDEAPDGWGRTYEFEADGTGYKTSFDSEDKDVYPITKWKITGSKIKITVVEDNVSIKENFDIDELNDNTLIFSRTVEQKLSAGIQKRYVKYTYERM